MSEMIDCYEHNEHMVASGKSDSVTIDGGKPPAESLMNCYVDDVVMDHTSRKISQPVIGKSISSHGTSSHGFLEHLKIMRQTPSIAGADGDDLIDSDAAASVDARASFARDVSGSSGIIGPPDDNHDDRIKHSLDDNDKSVVRSCPSHKILLSYVRSTNESITDANDSAALQPEKINMPSTIMSKNLRNETELIKGTDKCSIKWFLTFPCRLLQWSRNDEKAKTSTNDENREKNNTFLKSGTKVKQIQLRFKKP